MEDSKQENRIELTEEQLWAALDGGERVSCEPWKWGTKQTWKIEIGGIPYLVYLRFHIEVGLQAESGSTAIPAKLVEVTSKQWTAR